MPSFSNKKGLRFVITLGRGTFDVAGNDVVTLEGFRATADIDKAAGMIAGTLRAKIYGVRESDMHTVTTIAMQAAKYSEMLWQPNTVEVFAIDGQQETLVFGGNIINAFADYKGMPDVCLNIQANAAAYNRLKPVPPKSYKGSVDVATVMGVLAKQMGYVFENNGVNVTLSDVYLANTAMEQAEDLAKAAGIKMIIDDNVLAIMPMNGARKDSGLIPEISRDSGLVGYPTLDAAGVNFQCLFNPAIRFNHKFKLISDQIRAPGEWIATNIGLSLSSEMPGGPWFMAVRGNFQGTPYVAK